jgi:cystathionine gamma-lyase
METFMAHRSLATLHVRLERASRNARHIADMLAGRPDVDRVRHPALGSPAARAVAERQMRYFGPLVGFDVGTPERARRFFERARIITEATSFGGVMTTAERRARWNADDVSQGFIRLSAGCEDIDDLLADITYALGG